MAQADLELTLQRRDAESYGIDLRFNDPESQADNRLSSSMPIRFDLQELRQREADPISYGQSLTEQLFGDAEVRSFFDQSMAAIQAQDASLRLRFFIGPSAPELHSLRWETLRWPGRDAPLVTGENLYFSRYLSSSDWRPVRLRPKAELRALVVVASPSDVARYNLAPVDATVELAATRFGLGDIATTELATGGQATLNKLAEELREGYDILYLVAHGMLVDGEPWLFLEEDDGTTARVSGRDLVIRIQELRDRPRLVVLASCQSAGSGQTSTAQRSSPLLGLGPQLAQAGVPAVLAMHGSISVPTSQAFMSLLFQELRVDGQVDRAVAVARGQVRDRPDWWMPVLFMRLRTGRIWYLPGFGDQQQSLTEWPGLVRAIQRQRCTPILGPGLGEALLGARREIASRWAERYGFPMAPHSHDDLPQVAQYLLVEQGEFFLQDELEDHVRREVWDQFGDVLPANLRQASLDELITAVGVLQHDKDGLSPYQVLAQLPLPIYITTNPDNLLAEAIRAADRQPLVEICRWNEQVELLPSIFDDEPDYRPSPERPLIYHLFGRISEPDSLVLTEDDYFDFLIGVTTNNDLIPPVVRRALADSALLFLGFQIDEWDFRVLFRSVMNREGKTRRSRYTHVAAQINPEEGRILEPEGARRYLESYFSDADISIYWGSVDDFAQELHRRLT